MKPFTVISLGWGVQSFALAAMSAMGELPPVDAVVHSDTSHERSETYDLAREMTPWLEARGVRVVTVNGGRPVMGSLSGGGTYTSIPCFTTSESGEPSGMLRRQCTHDWKILPIRRWLQENRSGRQVEQWLGITLDEITRMRRSSVKYITMSYPFIEMFDTPWDRLRVMQWLNQNGLPIPVKSSCVFCPYHDRATWRDLKMSNNGDWSKALNVDHGIREQRPGYLCYLIKDRIPLGQADFRNQQDRGQLTLWDEECSGMCFL